MNTCWYSYVNKNQLLFICEYLFTKFYESALIYENATASRNCVFALIYENATVSNFSYTLIYENATPPQILFSNVLMLTFVLI